MLETEVVTTLDGMETLRAEWMALWRRCPTSSPFQTPAWLVPWWRRLGRGELLLVAWRGSGRLLGLAPLFVHEEGEARRLLLVGTGVTDYLDVLLDPEIAAQGPALLSRWLERREGRWDLCELQQLPPDSSLLRLPAPSGWRDEQSVQDACPVLALPDSPEALERTLPRRTVQHLRANRRRAEKSGRVLIDAASAEGTGPILQALVRLHGSRWNSRGLPGVLADPSVQEFHQEVAAEMRQAGLLRLYALHLEGEIGAVYYGFAGKGRAYAYLGGFEPAFQRLSLGSQVIAHAIEQAVREGATEFHFLRGREEYKYKWGARDRNNSRRRLSPRIRI